MSLTLRVTPAVVLLAAACSAGPSGEASTSGANTSGVTTTVTATTTTPPTTQVVTTTTQPAGPQLYQYIGTASQDADEEAMLCFGWSDLIIPPHCDGFPVLGLDWDEVPGADTHAGTTWAPVRLIGTFDGTAFAVTESPREPGARGEDDEPTVFELPCPTPIGGWKPTNPATATGWRRVEAKFYAEAQPEFAGTWLSGSVYVVGFTDRIEEHRERLLSIYGGPLCVTKRDHSVSELDEMAAELSALLSTQEAAEHGIWLPTNGRALVLTRIYTSPPLEAIVFAVTSPEAHDWIDRVFGKDLVRLTGALVPINPDA